MTLLSYADEFLLLHTPCLLPLTMKYMYQPNKAAYHMCSVTCMAANFFNLMLSV